MTENANTPLPPGQMVYGLASAAIILVGVLTVCSTVLGGSRDGGVIELNGSVRRSALQIEVTNRDAFAWRNCKVEINPNGLRAGYSQTIDLIGPGESVTGGLGSFTRNSERFNPATHVVEVVSIFCDTPEGEGHYMGSFR